MDAGLAALADADIGVFAFVGTKGRPAICAVTPYVVDGRAVVTSTLAYPGKARAVRSDERVALLAGGTSVEGRGRVGIDRTAAWFDRNLRDQELRKYPPASSVLGVPGHRRLFSWYVGRTVIAIEPERTVVRPGSDRVAVAVIDGVGRLHLIAQPIAAPADDARTVEVTAEVPDGDGVLLVHDERAGLAELHQLTLHGRITDGALRVERAARTRMGGDGFLGQLRTARTLAERARRAAATTAGWPPPPVG
jgi:hypothetical protein